MTLERSVAVTAARVARHQNTTRRPPLPMSRARRGSRVCSSSSSRIEVGPAGVDRAFDVGLRAGPELGGDDGSCERT